MSGTQQIDSSQDDAIPVIDSVIADCAVLGAVENSVRRATRIKRTTDRESTSPFSCIAEVYASIVVMHEDRGIAGEHIVRVALLRQLRRRHGVDLGRELGFRSTTRRPLIDWWRF